MPDTPNIADMAAEEFAAYKRSKRGGFRYSPLHLIEIRAIRDMHWQRTAWEYGDAP